MNPDEGLARLRYAVDMLPAPDAAFRGIPVALHVYVSDPDLVGDLVRFLRLTRCRAEPDGLGTVRVEVPYADDPRVAKAELDIYLRVWEETTPSAKAARLD